MSESRTRGRPATGETPFIKFRAPAANKSDWQAAADAHGLTLSEFLRAAAQYVCERTTADRKPRLCDPMFSEDEK